MRTKKEVEEEFDKVKANLEQAQQTVLNCNARLSELRG